MAVWGRIISTDGARPSGPPNSAVHGQWAARDAVYGGAGVIAGTIAVEDPLGTPERPYRARVALMDSRSLNIVRTAIADPSTGEYGWGYLRTDIPFLLLAQDDSGRYNAVVSEGVYAHP